jgi:hypothetical protein
MVEMVLGLAHPDQHGNPSGPTVTITGVVGYSGAASWPLAKGMASTTQGVATATKPDTSPTCPRDGATGGSIPKQAGGA